MMNDERNPNAQMTKRIGREFFCQSDFVIPSSLNIRHSPLSSVLLRDGKDGYLLLEKRNQAAGYDCICV